MLEVINATLEEAAKINGHGLHKQLHWLKKKAHKKMWASQAKIKLLHIHSNCFGMRVKESYIWIILEAKMGYKTEQKFTS